MIRTLLIASAVNLVIGVFPAAAYTCTEWCSIYHCNGRQAVRERVCMNRCVASCRLLHSKRNEHAS